MKYNSNEAFLENILSMNVAFYGSVIETEVFEPRNAFDWSFIKTNNNRSTLCAYGSTSIDDPPVVMSANRIQVRPNGLSVSNYLEGAGLDKHACYENECDDNEPHDCLRSRLAA